MAKEKLTNTSDIKSNVFHKGMYKDLADMYMSEGMWLNAINAINKSHLGELGSLSNEPSNTFCLKLPYVVIGIAYKKDQEWVLFLADGTNSEIGIFNGSDCSYTTIVNDECLGFVLTNLITGVVKENYDCTWSVYFQDNLNPDRVLNLDNVPYVGSNVLIPNTDNCYEWVNDTPLTLDCDKLRLHPLVQQPCVDIKKAQNSGQIKNGSYIAVIAYSENGVRLTDYSMPSAPQSLWDHTGIGGGLEVNITDLDENFEEFELTIIGIVNQQTVAKKIGYYNIDQTRIEIDLIHDSLETVPISNLPLRSTIYEHSEKMYELNDYLIRTSVTSQPHVNYQQKANEITSEWVAVAYPYEYYRDGGKNVGHMRGEVYPFSIRFVYKTGARTALYHIPGRKAIASDLLDLTGSDNIVNGKNLAWQVYDTSTKNSVNVPLNDEFNGVEIANGDMAYWESTERYPSDEPEIWGDLCGEPIRHHKFPSNETNHIHNHGGSEIYVMGVRFGNIAHPEDENGDIIEDIIGYEILRGSRESNKSIVAKGLFGNMCAFPYDVESEGPNSEIKYGLYQNYPYNDINNDNFLTNNRALVNEGDAEDPKFPDTYFMGERKYNDNYHLGGTSWVKTNYLSFHSPETNIMKPYLGSGAYINISMIERGTSIGNFRHPYKHPKHQLITDFAFGTAFMTGFGYGFMAALGNTNTKTERGLVSPLTTAGHYARDMSPTALGGFGDLLTTLRKNSRGLSGTIGAILSYISQFAYYTSIGTETIMRLIRAANKDHQYALQYNSYGEYNEFIDIPDMTGGLYKPSYSKEAIQSGIKYIGRGIQRMDSRYLINNLYRNKFVCIKLEEGSSIPLINSTYDTSRKRLYDYVDSSSFNRNQLFKHPNYYRMENPIAGYYGAIKYDFDNQYGQLRSIIQIPIASCVNETIPEQGQTVTTDILFGGDIYINRYTEKNPFLFFNTWLYDVPDGTGFDYRDYINGPLPRYWASTHKFDVDDFEISFDSLTTPDGVPPPPQMEDDYDDDEAAGDASAAQAVLWMKALRDIIRGGVMGLIDSVLKTPSDLHRLERPKEVSGKFIVKNSYFYLSYNGVRDFFCESEMNMAFRDYGEGDDDKFFDVYNHSFNDWDLMFRTDNIDKPVLHKYDLSLSASRLFYNFASWGQMLPRDYDPEVYSTCFETFPRRAIYSLQQTEGLKRDNWRNWLALNYKDFEGKINIIKALNKVGAVVLFEDAEPIVFTGTDTLTTTGGTKYTVGDSGLFAPANMKGIVNADDTLGYAHSISSRAAINTPFGLFFISQEIGKIMHFSDTLQEISKIGMQYWFAENLPSTMLAANPNFALYDNPVAGIGCQAIYDPTFELVYFTKKDYIPLSEDLFYDDPTGVPYTLEFLDQPISKDNPPLYKPYTDEKYFIDTSWTVSYDPANKTWISFHDWVPNLLIPTPIHFNTIKGNDIWKHNEAIDSYCKYYGIDYPWEVEYPILTPEEITTLRNIEYRMEVYNYDNDRKDWRHVLDENFDRAIIYNSEQISGLLKLNLKGKNTPSANLGYPLLGTALETPEPAFEILFSKEEHKYRFNQFWDITDNRGEFTPSTDMMWETDADGVHKNINQNFTDYTKSRLQRKKFRHYGNRLILRKIVSGANKMIVRLMTSKHLISKK